MAKLTNQVILCWLLYHSLL